MPQAPLAVAALAVAMGYVSGAGTTWFVKQLSNETRPSSRVPNTVGALIIIAFGLLGLYLHISVLIERFGFEFGRWESGPTPFAPGLLVDLGLFVLLLLWKEHVQPVSGD